MNRDTVRRKVDEARRVVTTKYRRRLLLLCFIALALAAAIVLVIFLQGGKDGPVCESDECKKIAKEIYANLDTSVDPCKDFYQFACGGWKKINPRPNDAQKWSRTSQMTQTVRQNLHSILSDESTLKEPFAFKQARRFYKSCSNFDKRDEYGIKGLRNIFKAIKGFPLIGEKAESFDFSKAIVYIHKTFPFMDSLFFEIRSTVNETTNQTVIELNPALNTDFVRKYGISLSNRTERIQIEIERVNTFKKAISVFKSSTDDMEIAQEVEKVVNLETTLMHLAFDDEDKNDESVIIPLPLAGQRFPGLDWKYIFTQTLGREITETTMIETGYSNFFENLGPHLLKHSKEVSANLLGLQLLETIGSAVVFKLKEIFENKTLTTEKKQEFCVFFVELFFQQAVTKMYLESILDQTSLRNIRKSVGQIKKALTVTFFESDWMDDQTKIKAQLKLNKMMDIIGTVIENDTQILNQDDMELFDSENFFNNFLKGSIWRMKTRLKGHSRKQDYGTVMTVNAFYIPQDNEIIVKPGFLTPPAYYFKGPTAMNFGTLGTVIGHEITHGFDNTGANFNEDGEYKFWWKNETFNKFNEKVQCFVEQYSNFTEPVTGQNINGQLTIGDNIADNGGVRQAFKAYKLYKALYNVSANNRLPNEMDGFDDEQLFFISFANMYCENHSKDYLQDQLRNDVHSPFVARVIVPLQNMEEFSKTFKCNQGTAMNPTNKCVLW